MRYGHSHPPAQQDPLRLGTSGEVTYEGLGFRGYIEVILGLYWGYIGTYRDNGKTTIQDLSFGFRGLGCRVL